LFEKFGYCDGLVEEGIYSFTGLVGEDDGRRPEEARYAWMCENERDNEQRYSLH
jgi:hypothetical protein